MTSLSWKVRASWLALVAAGALGIAFAAVPAAAQEDEYQGDQYDEQYQDGDAAYDEDMAEPDDVAVDEEEVEVLASRPRATPGGHIGLPAERMTMSHEVAYDDLDLRTRRGARELRARVREAADGVCGELSAMDPASDADYAPCYREATAKAMQRANAAIARARNYAYGY
jgi:UrcA family protein